MTGVHGTQRRDPCPEPFRHVVTPPSPRRRRPALPTSATRQPQTRVDEALEQPGQPVVRVESRRARSTAAGRAPRHRRPTPRAPRPCTPRPPRRGSRPGPSGTARVSRRWRSLLPSGPLDAHRRPFPRRSRMPSTASRCAASGARPMPPHAGSEDSSNTTTWESSVAVEGSTPGPARPRARRARRCRPGRSRRRPPTPRRRRDGPHRPDASRPGRDRSEQQDAPGGAERRRRRGIRDRAATASATPVQRSGSGAHEIVDGRTGGQRRSAPGDELATAGTSAGSAAARPPAGSTGPSRSASSAGRRARRPRRRRRPRPARAAPTRARSVGWLASRLVLVARRR